ncbi:MarR family winged helix-turn-helix transcriptional regulator [Curtobacterium flaccumfaciens pv. oortii]|uniref:MarR family winged helix-turn-helix transcriptional regulator n=1 Tax=Curtobacterium flaccumfaciens TaxID=2035 RepID=UPI0026589731|nr:MarR family winged helix-turn-helix transcriptional regulator [Curtobacterium flaccumfaciens]MCS5524334.1 MarR family winged helix-turn-helix transcriptional regulator [Curtobacterium flaccumfaciens pv. oortii]
MPQELPAPRDDVDGIVAWTVIRAARTLSRRLAAELAPFGLTPVEFGALIQLAAAGELSQADLARAVGVRPQSMTTLVGGLSTRGLVERGAAPGRGRASRMRLTDQGEALLARAHPIVRASNAWFGDGAEPISATLLPLLEPDAGDDGPAVP